MDADGHRREETEDRGQRTEDDPQITQITRIRKRGRRTEDRDYAPEK